MATLKSEYEQLTTDLDQYGRSVCSLILEALRGAGIQVHSVNFRVKDYKSVARKMDLGKGKYEDLSNLTDLLGIRVITYFPYDVDKVASALEKELEVDVENSVDKRKLLDSDKFGYLSLHYIVNLSPTRSRLIEYRKHSALKFEIQIRSILQHAWAEIEHDLGYKVEGALPNELRRSFSRLAGMLEFADEEFERIRNQIEEYKDYVTQTIDKAPQALKIDQSTVLEALKSERALEALDTAVAKADNSTLKDTYDIEMIGTHAEQLKILGVKDINHLIKLAKAYESHVETFSRLWLRGQDESEEILENNTSFYKGIGLFYLCYVLAAQLPSERLTHWNTNLQTSFPNIITEVKDIWSLVIKELGEPPAGAKQLIPQ